MFHVVLHILLLVIYISLSGLIACTLDGEEMAILSAMDYLELCGFCSEEFLLPLGAWDRLRYLIVVLPGPSI